MWNTVLNHGYGYSSLGGSLATKTYLVCKIDVEPETIIKENDKGTLAEIKLIDHLKKMPLLQNNVTVYINNSPCDACTKELKTYLEKKTGYSFDYICHSLVQHKT